ncbi:hypothetical protein [Streptomyces sp. SID1121]|uniref:hypothetical protein n=1 Tax=Streptomyces sp. SID1121 TaxID=3425888 RepID=UPI004057579E
MTTKKIFLLITLSCIALSSCSNTQDVQDKAATRIKISPLPRLYDGSRVALPLDSYFLSQDRLEKLDLALGVVANQCMSRFDASWPTRTHNENHILWNSRRYGVTSRNSAANYGYQAPLPQGISMESARRIEEAQKKRLDSVSEKTMAIYTGESRGGVRPPGVPSDGCRGEAYRALGLPGPDIDFQNAVTILQQRTWEDSRASPPVTAAAKRWSKCMKRHGYTYAEPDDALNDPRWSSHNNDKKAPSTPSGEIKAATTDVDCKRASLYAETWYGVEVQLQKKAIGQQGKTLADIKIKIEQLFKKIEMHTASLQ